MGGGRCVCGGGAAARDSIHSVPAFIFLTHILWGSVDYWIKNHLGIKIRVKNAPHTDKG